MSCTLRSFEPPLEVEIGPGIALLVRSAERDGRGGTVATMQTWNGELVHGDRVNLTLESQRRRYAKEVAGKVPELQQEQVVRRLLELEGSLSAILDQPEPETEAQPVPVDTAALWEGARDLAEDPKLLQRVWEALQRLGLVGERNNALLAFIAAVARLLLKPVNVIGKGPSSSGKSYTIETVVKLLPESAYVNYSTVSPRYLAYCDDDLRHRIVVIYEAAGMAEGMGAYIMRSLLSEGRLDLGTVDKNEAGGMEPRRLTKEGPTALFTTTTRAALEPELETRALSLNTDDTAKQSKDIVGALGAAAEGKAPEPPDLAPFHALQEWLAAAGERRVSIPFGRALARLTPCATVRIRRDFRMLLSMVSACAILHQAQRQKGGGGEVLADLADYALVRELLAEVFATTQQSGLTPAQREAVEAVITLCTEAGVADVGVSVADVAKHRGLDKSAAQKRLSGAAHGGYLRNLETRSRQPARYVVGDPLPEPVTLLPEVAQLAAAMHFEECD